MSKSSRPPSSQDKLRDLAIQHGMSDEAANAIASIDVTMTRIRHSLARRELARTVMAHLDTDLDMAHLDVISAISRFACEPAAEEVEVTVGYVAEQMNVDPSRASRLVADVVDRGYARRVASQQDSRRTCLELTERGEGFVDTFRDMKWDRFARSLGTWSETDLISFASLLDRFSRWNRADAEDSAPAPVVKRQEQDA